MTKDLFAEVGCGRRGGIGQQAGREFGRTSVYSDGGCPAFGRKFAASRGTMAGPLVLYGVFGRAPDPRPEEENEGLLMCVIMSLCRGKTLGLARGSEAARFAECFLHRYIGDQCPGFIVPGKWRGGRGGMGGIFVC